MKKAQKKRYWCIFAGLIIVLLMGLGCGDKPYKADIAIVNTNIIPMTDEILVEGVTVLVKDGVITGIVDSDAAIHRDAKIIEGSGRYLIPGLSDMHVHIAFPIDAALMVANGVTLVRNMWGSPLHLSNKEAYASGLLLGPEMWTAGPLLDGDPPIWDDLPFISPMVVTTPEEGRQAVLHTIAAGYDAVKVYTRLLPEVYYEILITAEENNFPVWGHVPTAVGVINAANAGQVTNEHLMEYSQSLTDPSKPLDSMIAATLENHMWNCPTLVIYDKLIRLEELLLDSSGIEGLEYVHPFQSAIWPFFEFFEQLPNLMDYYFSTTLSLYEAGGQLLVGTDTCGPYTVPGYSLHEELRLLVEEVGLAPEVVLRMATYNAASFLGITDRLGSIEEGKEADFVLLTDNPLDDITNTRNRVGVMIDGNWYTNEALVQILDELAEGF